jgi:hypothetical protein
MAEWVTPDQGLAFVRIIVPTAAETDWANTLAAAINSGIDGYLGAGFQVDYPPQPEILASAQRAFGYAWKYREAPFGEAQWLDEQGGSVRLARDWIDPIKPILNRYRDVSQMIG